MSDEKVEPSGDVDHPDHEMIALACDETSENRSVTAQAAADLANGVADQFAPFAQMLESQRQLYAQFAAASSSARAAASLARTQQNLRQVAENLAASGDSARAVAQAFENQRVAQAMKELANAPFFRAVQEVRDRIRAWHESQLEAWEQTRAFFKKTADSVGPWLTSAAEAVGRTFGEVYRRAAPPNWIVDNNTPAFSYASAMQLALDEGIPLAWAADPETVVALMAVPNDDSARRATLRVVLDNRAEHILGYSEARLDELARDSRTSAALRPIIDVALQSIHALRHGLPAPAQSAAANLVDHLIRRLFAPLEKRNGKLSYRKKREQVEKLHDQISTVSLAFLGVLREMVTLLAIAKSLTEWWPDEGQALPDSFSRHTTAHAIAEPGQVNPTNALIAVMLAVSLVCQEADSEWTALGTLVWKHEDSTGRVLDVIARRQSQPDEQS